LLGLGQATWLQQWPNSFGDYDEYLLAANSCKN
jgi:hypothetical protein